MSGCVNEYRPKTAGSSVNTLSRERLLQLIEHVLVRLATDPSQQVQVEVAPDDRGQLQQPHHVGREATDPSVEQVPHRLRHADRVRHAERRASVHPVAGALRFR